MRELDVLLSAYLETQYPDSGERNKRAFRKLLELPDPELNAYLLGGEQSADSEIASVVELIRGKPTA